MYGKEQYNENIRKVKYLAEIFLKVTSVIPDLTKIDKIMVE